MGKIKNLWEINGIYGINWEIEFEMSDVQKLTKQTSEAAEMRPKGNRVAHRRRVIAVKTQILELIEAGEFLWEIRRLVGLEDIPKSSFYRHVKNIREAQKSSVQAEKLTGSSQPSNGLAAGRATPVHTERIPVEDENPTNQLTAQPQSPNPTPEPEPSKALPPKKRKFVRSTLRQDKPKRSLNPADWKVEI